MSEIQENPNCEQTLAMIDEFVDGELSADGRAAVERHVTSCATCRAELEALTELDSKLRSALPKPQPEQVERVAQRFEATASHSVSPQGFPTHPRKQLLTWLACAAAAIAIVILARPTTPPSDADPNVPVAVTPVAGQLVAATGQLQYQPADGKWQSLMPATSIDIAEGGRLRTLDASCEIRLPQDGKLRLHRDSEVVLHKSDRVRLLQGQLWAQGPKTGDLTVEVPTVGADEPKEIVMNCPSNSEVQWSVHDSRTAASSSTAVTMHSGEFSCDVPPGQTVVFDRNLKTPAVFTSLEAEHHKSWQIPLLHAQGAAAEEELQRLVESALSKIGFTKASYFYESQIRALGAAGAPPLLAYARTPESREKPQVRRRAAVLGAELADASMIESLRTLSFDDDPEVREPILKAIERLEKQ